MLVNQILLLKPIELSMSFQETATMYKNDKEYNDFRYFSSAHTVDPSKSANAYNDFLAFLSTYRFALAKVTRVTMIL